MNRCSSLPPLSIRKTNVVQTAITMTLPLHSASDDGLYIPDPSVANNASNAIQCYLQDTLEISKTVEELTSRIDSEYSNHRYELVESALGSTWTTFNHVVYQVPHDHPWHTKLVVLLAAIKLRPSPSGQEDRAIWAVKLWGDLPCWGPDVTGDWADPATVLRFQQIPEEEEYARRMGPRDHESLRNKWTRMNALMAKLVTSSAGNFDFHAGLAMRAGLEEPLSQSELSANLPGAAVWVFYAGAFLFRLNRERWPFWKQRFAEVAADVDAEDETKAYAGRAQSRMIVVENETLNG